MSFTITHLIISKNISKIFENHIESLPQFYLGTIAPDAVHNRENYISDYKKASHLITGTERWGMITNTDEWEANVIAFLKNSRKSENRDFILGYCSHILADIYNTTNMWTPFRLKYPDELEKGYSGMYHQESNKIDINLALTYEGREEFWSNIAKSNSIDLSDIIYASEIDKQKDNILNLWYKDKELQDISSNKVKTYESEMDFIKNATDFVALVFKENSLG